MTDTLTDPSTSSALSGLTSSLAACNKRAPKVLLGESEGNSTGSLRQAASDLRRSAENTTRPGKLSKQRKTVGFAFDTELISLSQTMPEISFPNFCNNSNFCTHVHNLLAKDYVDGHPVGYLDAQGCTKHLIYLTSQQRMFNMASTTTPVLESLKKFYGGSEVSMPDTASLAT